MTDPADKDRPWWFPELTDDAWIARVRADYPEATADLDDEAVREMYADGMKYADTWDHVGDARESYEKLADAYLALLPSIKAALHILDRDACFVDNELRITLTEYRHGQCPRVLAEAVAALRAALKETS